MTSELPEGLKVWYQYDETLRSPRGRLLVDSDGRGVPRRRTTAHVYEVRVVHETDDEMVMGRREVARGVAVCRPDEAFVKNIGRATALKRALGKLDRAGQLNQSDQGAERNRWKPLVLPEVRAELEELKDQ